MTEISAFLNELGGPKAVANKIGKRPGTISVWVFRQRIPRSAWPELVSAYPSVTLERLMETESGTAKQNA